jgi:predicted Zn-dependent peptidase
LYIRWIFFIAPFPEVTEYCLKNGLKLLVVERKTSPTVALRLYVKVGSCNEIAGITGISHLLEHMLGKGGSKVLCTKDYEKEVPILKKIDQLMEKLDTLQDEKEIQKLKKELIKLKEEQKKLTNPREIIDLFRKAGSRYGNAYTSRDVTCYHRNLPSNAIELWMWIMSDLLLNPVFRWFYSERDVVKEERRMWHETTPRGKLSERFRAVAFTAHEYRHPILGWMSDIKKLKRKDLFDYFSTYYVANNIIISIVGDVEKEEVYKLVDTYFSRLPSKDVPRLKTEEPPQRGERRVILEEEGKPYIIIGYHIPEVLHPDFFALEVIDEILTGGRGSRLYKKLVLEEKKCSGIDGYNEIRKYPGLFIIYASPFNYNYKEIENSIEEEIETLKTSYVTDYELIKAKTRLEASFYRSIRTNRGLAELLGRYEALCGWKFLKEYLVKIKKVTKEEIKEVARKYFKNSNKTVGIIKK